MAIDFEVKDRTAIICLNRPEKLNALDADHYKGLAEAWIRVRDDSQIRVAVITGAGDRSFTTGADLKAPRAHEGLADAWLTQHDQLLNRGLEIWKPVIAAVNGYCLGGGMTLLLATDIRIAVPHATFGLSEVKRAIIPGNGGTQRLLSQLPHAIAMEMLLTGDGIDAETALRWGLLNRVVEPGMLMDTAMDYARRIERNGPLAVQAAKELALRSREMSLNDGLRLEAITGRLLHTSIDAGEGRLAFAEKRLPDFKGE